jgi:predicted AAA+ superfamily ATPase
MLDRDIAQQVRSDLRHYPAAAVVGPRQCGKTTLAAAMGGDYFDLEALEERTRLDVQWNDLARGKRLVILDEAQEHPPVFARLRGTIDQDRKRNGRFLILGSVSPTLMKHVSESLAGRLALTELTPLYLSELQTQAQRSRHWLRGGFPDGGVLKPSAFPKWQRNYVSTITQRDLPAWGLPAAPQQTERLLAMLAALQGQMWNASRLGQSMGLAYHTVNSYLDFLEGAFLIRRLHPYSANIRKRLVKAPKVFLRDSGLLHAVLGATNQSSLLRQPWVGASWEGYVIEQVLARLGALGRQARPYFFRTSDMHELDLVLEVDASLWAFEIKLTSAPSPAHLHALHKVADMIGASRRILVSHVAQPAETKAVLSSNLAYLLKAMAEW